MEIFDALAAGDSITLILSLIVLGCFGGFMAGLLGVGGGIIVVPGLLFIFHSIGFESQSLIHVCVGTSLALIVPTGLMSARGHWKKGAVDSALVRQIGGGIVVGVGVGTLLANVLSGLQLQMIFATAIIILAGIMVANPARFKGVQSMPRQPWPSLAGSVIGTVSSLIGIGGGTLSVPFMSLCGVPIHRAIGTASALGVVIAIPAALGFVAIGWEEAGRPPFSIGYVNMLAWVMVLPSSLVCVRVGVWAAHKIPVTVMRRVFASFMVLVALKMWAEIL